MNRAKPKVTEILPVTLAPKGTIGIIPVRLVIKIIKNTESKKGKNFSYFSPIEDLTISSLTNITIGSITDNKPLGGSPFVWLAIFTDFNTKKAVRVSPTSSPIRFFVMLKS